MGGFGGEMEGPGSGGAMATSMCTEDAGVLTPIGPQGCAPNETVVYRSALAGTYTSSIASAAGAANTPSAAMVTACTSMQCAPGQVAVVTYAPTASSDPFPDASGSDGAAPASGDGAAPAPVVDGGAASAPVDAASPADGEAPDASAIATADASGDGDGGATASSGDAGVLEIPCGAVVTCIVPPPTCPAGQSPSYAPNGQWHCLPLCDPNSNDSVVITYGATYGNTSICAGAPPTTACPTQGQVWTWDYYTEEWVCAPECNGGQFDQHEYNGQMVCVPC